MYRRHILSQKNKDVDEIQTDIKQETEFEKMLTRKKTKE